MKHMLKLMEPKVVKGQPLHVAVMHADALDKAIALKDRISSRFECHEIFITEFTPVMGVHTGPGLIGVAFYSEELPVRLFLMPSSETGGEPPII